MQICPFCNTTLNAENTFCETCGYSFVLPLPYPVLAHRKIYFALSISSILSGILASVFTFFPAVYMGSLFLVIGTIGLASVVLEKTWGRCDTSAIKILAIIGLFFGVLGYIFFMFIRSNVPVSGYSM